MLLRLLHTEKKQGSTEATEHSDSYFHGIRVLFGFSLGNAWILPAPVLGGPEMDPQQLTL